MPTEHGPGLGQHSKVDALYALIVQAHPALDEFSPAQMRQQTRAAHQKLTGSGLVAEIVRHARGSIR